jgi:hypothetical protein
MLIHINYDYYDVTLGFCCCTIHEALKKLKWLGSDTKWDGRLNESLSRRFLSKRKCCVKGICTLHWDTISKTHILQRMHI